jgi:colicin import membrane protein
VVSEMVMSSPDRHPETAVALAAPATIVGLGGRHPEAAVAVAVPCTIVGIAGVAAHPLVFVPLLVLVAVALVVSDIYTRQKRGAAQHPHVASAAKRHNRQQRADRAKAQAQRRRRRLELQAEAEAAEAEAVAAWARAQVIRLQLEAEASAKPVLRSD